MYLVLLRTVFFLSAVSWVLLFFVLEQPYDIQWHAIYIVTFTLTLVHQITYAFAVRFLCDNPIDLLWLAGDLAGFLYYAITTGSWYFYSGDSQLDVVQSILLWCLMILLPILLVSRAYFWFQARKRVSKRPSCLQELKAVNILFGDSLWNERLIGETKKLAVARGLVASLLLLGVVAFFLVSTLTGPFQELSFVPTQDTRTLDDRTPYSGLMSPSVWGVTFGISSAVHWQPIPPGYPAAVDVIPLWDNSTSTKPACVNLGQNPSDLSQIYGLEMQISTLTYYCPSRPSREGDVADLRRDEPQMFYNEFQPDLLLTVNFTTLGRSVGSVIDIATNSVQVMVSMTNNTADVVAMTTPTVLIPGANLVGLVAMEVRQKYIHPGWATLGLFGSVQSILIGQVAHLYPDPSPSTLITRAPEIATLRLSVIRDAAQWNIISDTKKNTFLSGFSKIGGLWTFLSGIFAAVFGSSLIRILFGIKPISVFGLAHRWKRGAIKKAYRTEYPAILDEMSVPQHQRGLLCLIQDHIIDLNLMEEPVEYTDDAFESRTKSMELMRPGTI